MSGFGGKINKREKNENERGAKETIFVCVRVRKRHFMMMVAKGAYECFNVEYHFLVVCFVRIAFLYTQPMLMLMINAKNNERHQNTI